ncbi:MAG: hypothetical protein ACRD0P_27080 [Stackebrandtia sp.]
MRTAVLGAVVVLVVPCLTACDPIVGEAPTAGRCRVKFAQPYRPTVTAGRLIHGQASALCTGPVDQHHVTLYLERNTGSTWEARDQETSDAIPSPAAVDLTVIVECRPGTWRLRYDLSATAAGKSAHAGDASDQLTLKSQQDCAKPQ